MPPNETINNKENKEVKIMNMWYKKHQVTMVLNITADGSDLNSFLILKFK